MEKEMNVWSKVHGLCGFDIWNIIEDTEKMDESILVDELKRLSEKYIVDLFSSIDSIDDDEILKRQLEDFFVEFHENEEIYRQTIFEEFKDNYDVKYVGRMVYSDYVIYGHRKNQIKDKNLPAFVYCENGNLFKTIEDSIYLSHDFPEDILPKKFLTLSDTYDEIKKVKKKFPELDWNSAPTKKEYQKY